MSDPSPEILQSVNHVIQAFDKYTVTSDKSLITCFSREELERAINLYSGDQSARGRGWYRVIQRRLDVMDQDERNRRKTRDKWKDRFIGAGITLVVWAITEFIKRALN